MEKKIDWKNVAFWILIGLGILLLVGSFVK